MKKNFKIKSIMVVVAILITSLMLSVSLFVTPAQASACEVFEMEKGASVKLSDNGLRFTAKMDAGYRDMIVNNPNVELWGYIAPTEEFDKVSEYRDLAIKVGGQLDESKIYLANDGYYHVNIVITDLDEYTSESKPLYGRSFSAIVFIKDTSTNTYIYADLAKGGNGVSDLALQNRTQYQVVNAAMLDAEESYENDIMAVYGSWYGASNEYPILLDSQENIDAFVQKLSDVTFKNAVSGKHIFVNQALASEASAKIPSGLGVSVSAGHKVNFWDGNKLLKTIFVADGANADSFTPVRSGYTFISWTGASLNSVTEDRNLYAKWKGTKGDANDIGDMTVYGVTRADGIEINSDADVIGQKVTLASGYLGDGAYYPGETNGTPDPTDENDTADQAYLAFDGNYGFNDYFVADFTGKNMPTLAFFANNYDNSIFYGDGTKNGVVVATGLTWPDGRLFTESVAYCTTVFNGKGLCMWGPHMIYSTAKNVNPQGVLLHSNVENVAIGRENLVAGKQYRVIMGMKPGADRRAITLVYVLYDLDNNVIVEKGEYTTYNFFENDWANAGQTRDQFCQGSIVAYGHFGTTTVLDTVHGIYEDTTIEAISRELGMVETYNTTIDGDSVTLGTGALGSPSDGYVGPSANDNGYQAYYALNGDYSFDDYVVFDFTGKNMPEVAFFARDYDSFMYAENGGKHGVVVASGVMAWDGSGYSSLGSNCTKVCVSGPYMADYNGADANGGNLMDAFSANLARANLVDGTQYRIIMGFTKGTDSRAITLKYMLYNLTTNTVVETKSQTSWNLFNNVFTESRDTLHGSIVLYGKFNNVTTTIDKIHGVFENTTIEEIKDQLAIDQKTVVFKNWDGEDLQTVQVATGAIPVYTGVTPTKSADYVCSSYTFAGWDREIVAVTGDTVYTATFTGVKRSSVSVSTSKPVTLDGKVTLGAGGIGDGASYTTGQNNGGYVDQSYIAFDGNYGLNSYVAFDFTGKNMPEVAFFAKNYNNSMYAEGTSKQGIVVVTGITTWDGADIAEVNKDKPNGTYINYGFPYMIQKASDGGFCDGAFAKSELGRANLVDGTHYRVIMGFTGSGNAITLNWYLYNLDTKAVVEQSSMTTWNFFTGSNAQVGNMTINDLSGSIVLYGKFGVDCTLDQVHGVFTNTDITSLATGLNSNATYTVRFEDENGNCLQEEELTYGAMPSFKGVLPSKEDDALFTYNYSWDKALVQVTSDATYVLTCSKEFREDVTDDSVTVNNETVVLGSGNIGSGADYIKGQNAGGSITQSYLAFDGNYGFDDYIVFDFTGKNMPEIMFFADNYDASMYYSEGKQGIVVASGITLWNGSLCDKFGNNTKVAVSGPFGAYYEGAAAPYGGNMMDAFSSSLARANLADGTHYRIIMGMTNNGNTFTVKYMLYNIDTEEIVEEVSQTSWAFFTGSNAAVNNMTLGDLSGSIVLYGKFGTTTTIDKIWGVFEDTSLEDVALSVIPQEEGEDEPTLNVPDYSAYTDQFDFYAYSAYSDGYYEIDGEKYYIGKNLANLKQYSLYGEAGMTIYFPQNDMLIDGSTESIDKAKKLIDDLAKVGIHKTILEDSRILYLSLLQDGLPAEYDTNEELDAYIYNCVKDYATYPGVYGIQLGDEPRYACLDEYSAVYRSIKRVNEKYGFNLFIQYNLNPLNVTQVVYDEYYPASSGTYEWTNYRYKLGLRDRFTDSVTRYTQYINDFLTAMNPDSIMYDDYPLMEDKNGKLVISDSYIPCLQIVAKAAADRGIKFYNVTQAYENNADGSLHRREMTEAGAKWLNNILLGFGAKQIAYYTYYTRSESDSTGGESYVDGKSFVDYNGNPTSLYYWMQTIMANNQKFAPTIMQFDYKGSNYYKGSSVSTNKDHVAEITVSDSFAKLSAFAVDKELALVTELYDDENNYYMYMAMNISNPDVGLYTQTVTMTFSGYSHVLVYVDGVASTYALNNNVYTTTLNAGEAVYVIPFN